ncbi:MAG: hypothetical protein PHQ34_14550 [Methanothrix sp.]|nr:hypothetical protein [Methanothrix sp.]
MTINLDLAYEKALFCGRPLPGPLSRPAMSRHGIFAVFQGDITAAFTLRIAARKSGNL